LKNKNTFKVYTSLDGIFKISEKYYILGKEDAFSAAKLD
jgi:hypothetical protein